MDCRAVHIETKCMSVQNVACTEFVKMKNTNIILKKTVVAYLLKYSQSKHYNQHQRYIKVKCVLEQSLLFAHFSKKRDNPDPCITAFFKCKMHTWCLYNNSFQIVCYTPYVVTLPGPVTFKTETRPELRE